MQYNLKESCLSDLLTAKVIEKSKRKEEPEILYLYEKIFDRYSNNRMISCKLRIAYEKQDTFEGMTCALLGENHEKKSIFYLPRPKEKYDTEMASLESLLGDRADAKIEGNSILMTTGVGFMKNLSRTAYFALPLAALTSAALVEIAGSPTLWNIVWTAFVAGSIQETYIRNLPDIKKEEKGLVERARKMDSILSDLSDKYGDALLRVL